MFVRKTLSAPARARPEIGGWTTEEQWADGHRVPVVAGLLRRAPRCDSCCGRAREWPIPARRRLHQDKPLSLGDAFSFMSGLYFRGKITYARAFAEPPPDATLVITPTRGCAVARFRRQQQPLLHEFAGVDISSDDVRYSEPLERDSPSPLRRGFPTAPAWSSWAASPPANTWTSWCAGWGSGCTIPRVLRRPRRHEPGRAAAAARGQRRRARVRRVGYGRPPAWPEAAEARPGDAGQAARRATRRPRPGLSER